MSDSAAAAARAAKAFLDSLDLATVVEIATALAPPPRLALEPGWSFGGREQDPDRITAVRREIWTYFSEHAGDRPLVLPWHCGLRINAYLGNDVARCVYVAGAYEPNELVFWRTILRPGMVFLDGGANEGLYTLLAASLVGPTGLVVAVEPSGRELERLAANVALNGLENVRLVRAALHRMDGEAALAVAEPEHAGQNTIGEAVANPNVRVIGHEQVTLVMLDRLVEAEGLARLDAVKLDLEGCEVHALAGGRKTIARFRPLVQLEVGERSLVEQGSTASQLVDAAHELGYRLFVFDAATAQLRPARDSEELRLNVIAAPRGWTPPLLPAS